MSDSEIPPHVHAVIGWLAEGCFYPQYDGVNTENGTGVPFWLLRFPKWRNIAVHIWADGIVSVLGVNADQIKRIDLADPQSLYQITWAIDEILSEHR